MTRAYPKYVALLIAFLAAWSVNNMVLSLGGAAANIACIALAALWLCAAVWAFVKKREAISTIVLCGGFVAGLIFVLKMPYHFSWHDLASYSAELGGANNPDGHLGYIAWLVENSGLPTMDPTQAGMSVLYNPPLFHLLASWFMRLNLWMGFPTELSLENLQLLNWLFACACSLVTLDVLNVAGVGERGMRVGAAVVAFAPMMWIMGATPNNDILSVLCAMACILFTLRWEKSRRMGDIIGIALTLGAGMASKLSVSLLIPCVAVVFAVAFFRDLPHWKKYVGQFALFLLLSVPIACAWPLYHLLAHGIPLNYVRLPAETLNVSAYSLWQRFGVPDGNAVRELFFTGVRKTDHNVWMQTLKTAMFDELTLFEKGTRMWYVAYAYMAMFAGLALIGIATFVRTLCKQRELSALSRVFLGGYALILMLNYVVFCLQYPYVCTFNFRYIMPALLLCALGVGSFCEKARHSWWLTAYVAAFCTLGVLVYGVYLF